MSLEVCRKDFEALIQKIQLLGHSNLSPKYVQFSTVEPLIFVSTVSRCNSLHCPCLKKSPVYLNPT